MECTERSEWPDVILCLVGLLLFLAFICIPSIILREVSQAAKSLSVRMCEVKWMILFRVGNYIKALRCKFTKSRSTVNLKACPKCGSEFIAIHPFPIWRNSQHHLVVCGTTPMNGCNFVVGGYTREEAIKTWNTTAESAKSHL